MKTISFWILIACIAVCQVAEAESYIPIGSSLSTTAWTPARDAESPPRRRMTNAEMAIVNSGKMIKFGDNDFVKRNQLFNLNRSNLDRMKLGLAPIGKDGHPINLHHMKQQNGGTIVEASHTEHKDNSGSWHRYTRLSEIERDKFNYRTKPAYWKERARDFEFRGRNAGYISLGTATAMAIGPELWNLFNTGSVTDKSMLRVAHPASIIATERAANYALYKLGMQGSLRGNVIIGTTIFAADTAWSAYEHGGGRAFQNEGFYTNLGGSVGSILGAAAVAIPVSLITLNPVTGFLAGLSGGTAGNIEGRNAARDILKAIDPEFIHKAEDTAIDDAQKNVQNSISRIQQELDS